MKYSSCQHLVSVHMSKVVSSGLSCWWQHYPIAYWTNSNTFMFYCNIILQVYTRKSWLWSRLFWEKLLYKTYFYFTANPIRDTYKSDIGSIFENNWRDFNKKWEWICFCWKQCQIGYWSFLCEQLVEISTRNGSGSFLYPWLLIVSFIWGKEIHFGSSPNQPGYWAFILSVQNMKI